MEERTLGYAFAAWVVVSICAGTGFILFGPTFLTMVGAVLIMLGLMGLMPMLRFTVMRAESSE